METSKILKAGQIAKEVVAYAKTIIKKDMLLLDIAEKIEAKIIELGGKPAFPVNLSINEIAAHYTPSYDDETKASGLLKIDIGVQIDGWTADTAFSLDLEESEENKKLIEAAEKALQSAINTVKDKKTLNEIGKSIHDSIISINEDFSPIRNLSGHEIDQHLLHAGITIPNYDNGNEKLLEDGLYAIEPFSTTGAGVVYDGKDSGIYYLLERKAIRDNLARQIIDFIEQEYKHLPFCSRWIVKKFGTRALISLSLMEKSGILHHFPQLVDKNHGKVAQSEHTILIEKEKIQVTTK